MQPRPTNVIKKKGACVPVDGRSVFVTSFFFRPGFNEATMCTHLPCSTHNVRVRYSDCLSLSVCAGIAQHRVCESSQELEEEERKSSLCSAEHAACFSIHEPGHSSSVITPCITECILGRLRSVLATTDTRFPGRARWRLQYRSAAHRHTRAQSQPNALSLSP